MERKKLTEYQNLIGYIITELYSKIDFYIFNIETEYDYISIFNFRLGKLYIIKLNIFDKTLSLCKKHKDEYREIYTDSTRNINLVLADIINIINKELKNG
uniref:hypothetical protein n=1 Tax=Brachyspira catarrhinii TaxID=2528966 RepID=UPI003F4B41E6